MKGFALIAVAALIASSPSAGLAAEPTPGPTPSPAADETVPPPAAAPATATDDLPTAQPSPPPGEADTDTETGNLFAPSRSFPENNPDDGTPAPVKKPERPTVNFSAQTNPAVQLVSVISQQGLSNGESLFNGLGGIPNPLSARALSASFDRRVGFPLGTAWVRPSLDLGVVYRSQHGQTADGNYEDAYATITPSVSLAVGLPEAGRTFTLQYQGVVAVGQTEGMGTYDQILQINGVYTLTKLSLGFGLQASQLTGSDQDFSGDNADRLLLALSGTLDYQYSEKTSLDATVAVPLRLYQQGDSSEGITSQTFLNWAYSPLTRISAGLGLGTLVVEGRTQVFEQGLLRLTYAPSPVVSLDATVGYEFRQTGDEEINTPIYRLGVSWLPFYGTSLTLSGERSVYNSAALSDADYTTTSISLTASQRIGRYLQATGTFGYNDNSYESTGTGSVYGRDEQYFIFQAGLSAQLNTHLRIGLTVDYSRLNSSGGAPGFVLNAANNASSYGIASGNLRVIQTSFQIGYDF